MSDKERKDIEPKDKARKGKDRKERVIHTRVPENLDQQLKTKAEGLGISVSKLIRHVLNNTFELVDDIVADSTDIARAAKKSLSDQVEQTAPDTEAAADANSETDIIGWQQVVLNVNAICHRCNAILPKGSQAHLGLASRPSNNPPILCTTCIEELTNESNIHTH